MGQFWRLSWTAATYFPSPVKQQYNGQVLTPIQFKMRLAFCFSEFFLLLQCRRYILQRQLNQAYYNDIQRSKANAEKLQLLPRSPPHLSGADVVRGGASRLRESAEGEVRRRVGDEPGDHKGLRARGGVPAGVRGAERGGPGPELRRIPRGMGGADGEFCDKRTEPGREEREVDPEEPRDLHDKLRDIQAVGLQMINQFILPIRQPPQIASPPCSPLVSMSFTSQSYPTLLYIRINEHHFGDTSPPSFSTTLFAIFALRCLQNVFTAASTVAIFSASSFGMSNPKYSSMATTSSTESSESKPSSSKVAWRESFDWLHLFAVLRTWKIFASTSSSRATWVESEDEVKANLLRERAKGAGVNVLNCLVRVERGRVNIFRSIGRYGYGLNQIQQADQLLIIRIYYWCKDRRIRLLINCQQIQNIIEKKKGFVCNLHFVRRRVILLKIRDNMLSLLISLSVSVLWQGGQFEALICQ